MRPYVLAAAMLTGVSIAYYLAVTLPAQTSLAPPATINANLAQSAGLVSREVSSAANKANSASEVALERQTNDPTVTPVDTAATVIDLGPDISPEDIIVYEASAMIDLGPRISPEDEPIASYNTEIIDLGPRISPDEDADYYTDNASNNEPVVDLGDPINVEDAAGYSSESAVLIDIGPALDADSGQPVDL